MGKEAKKREAPAAVVEDLSHSGGKDVSERPAKKAKASTSSSISMPKRTTSKKTSTPDVEREPSVASEESDNDAPEPSQATHLHGFSSGSDSSDSDSDDDEEIDDAPVDVGKLPTIAKDDATVKRKLAKAHKQPVVDRGVVYIGRIPHGFYEDQMKGYFTQFGEVTRVRISRNKKTGRSKHYGFLEFASSAVAEIVCETMNNYLLLGHILVCEMIPKDRVHPELWIGANRKWRKVPMDRVARVAHNRERDDASKARVEARLLKRQQQKQQKLAAAGIDYDISPVGYSSKPIAAT